MRRFSENVHDDVLVPVDLDGTVVGSNAGGARTFGYTAEEIVRKDSACFFNPEDIAGARRRRPLHARDERHPRRSHGHLRRDDSRAQPPAQSPVQ